MTPNRPLVRGDSVVTAAVHVGGRRLGLGDLDVEGRAAVTVRLDPDAAVDAANELAADVETQPGAADPARHVGVEAEELLEDAPLLRGWDPEALVDDREP